MLRAVSATGVLRGLPRTDELGRSLHPDVVSDRFDKLVADAGLRRIRAHDCRHTAARLMLASGEPVTSTRRSSIRRAASAVPSALASSTTITLSTYAHTLPGMAEQAGERLSASILG